MELIVVNCVRGVVFAVTLDVVLEDSIMIDCIIKDWLDLVYKPVALVLIVPFVEEELSDSGYLFLKMQEETSDIDAVKSCRTKLLSLLAFNYNAIDWIADCIVPALKMDLLCFLL